MTFTQEMPAVATASFDPSAVVATTRANWCDSQSQTCPEICYGSASANYCSTNDLSFSCVCSNGTVPDVTAFVNTLPYYVCQQTFAQCMAKNSGDASGQQQCQDNEQCGTRDAMAEFVAYQSRGLISSTSTLSSTSTSTPSGTRTSPAISTDTITSISTTTASSTASTTMATASKPGLSPGALVGIAIGSAVGALLIALLAFLLYRRHKKHQISEHNDDPLSSEGAADASSTPGAPRMDVAEVAGGGQEYDSMAKRKTTAMTEMHTNSNRHELDDTQLSGTPNAPWSDTTEGRYELGPRASVS